MWRDKFNERMGEYVMNLYLFGKTNAYCCANWALKRTATDHEKIFSLEIVKIAMEKFYMDDCLDSFNHINKAIYTTHSKNDIQILLVF